MQGSWCWGWGEQANRPVDVLLCAGRRVCPAPHLFQEVAYALESAGAIQLDGDAILRLWNEQFIGFLVRLVECQQIRALVEFNTALQADGQHAMLGA